MDTRNVETCGARRGLLGCWALGLAILASVALLAACSGRGLVDETYPGHALATAQGSLAATAEPVRDAVSLGIAWLPSGVGGHPLDRIEALLDPRPFAGTRCAVVPLRGAPMMRIVGCSGSSGRCAIRSSASPSAALSS